VLLLGRDEEELHKSVADLKVRGTAGARHAFLHCDLLQSAQFPDVVNQAKDVLGRVDVVVVTAGLFATQDVLEEDPQKAAEVMSADFTNTVLFCEAARKMLLTQGGGTLCVFSSVAGDRGRSPVVIYGAAKAGLSAYLEGLDHRYRRDGLITVCVKPGFVRTAMTEGLRAPPFAGESDSVAAEVIEAMDAGAPVVYAPRAWNAVMRVVRALPRSVMRRVKF
jgi:decaprenylphospho-beta-D-erythro-pentofuranosid-2-ulose 2-reductase